MPDTFAVAVMTENIDNGAMDLKLRTFEAASREEALGMAWDYYQSHGVVTHKLTAIRVMVGDDSAFAVYLELLREGKKIHAIKQYREDTGFGLRESKEFIDNLEVKHGLGRNRR